MQGKYHQQHINFVFAEFSSFTNVPSLETYLQIKSSLFFFFGPSNYVKI